MQQGATLTPLDDALAHLLAGLVPVATATVPLGEALGAVAAETLRAGRRLPPQALALRRGIAVASADLVGASPYAPAMLTTPPRLVLPGDALPPGTDAVLPADAIASAGPFHEIGQAAYPGEGAAPAGSDLAEGAVLLRVGETVTAEAVLALALAGIATVQIRRPRVQLTGETGGAEAVWLGARLAAAGFAVGPGPAADLVLHFDADPVGGTADLAGLALRPGGDVALAVDPPRRLVALVPRFDAAAAVLFALLMPFAATATARRLRSVARPLTRKIVSQVGLAEIALLRDTEEGWEPLGVGRVTLAALLAADAVAVVDPASEGAPAGSSLAACPLTEPFEPR